LLYRGNPRCCDIGFTAASATGLLIDDPIPDHGSGQIQIVGMSKMIPLDEVVIVGRVGIADEDTLHEGMRT
jgi:hypothetical protein